MTLDSEITLREAGQDDRENVFRVELLSTPNLSYLPYVWNLFINDRKGEWTVAEIDGEVIGCGKYSLLPDGSAWLETLRVVPQWQGIGVGKRFYEHWFNLSRKKGVKTMRMYTGVKNTASRGLAIRYGLRPEETFRGTLINSDSVKAESDWSFNRVTDSRKAKRLLMRHTELWGGWVVMNRTFYRMSPELCIHLTEEGMVHEDPETNSVIVLGTRFNPKHGLHIGLFAGDVEACLCFALQMAVKGGIGKLHCLFPSYTTGVEEALTRFGFHREPTDFLVMEANLA
ncbi:MAG: GNAT family N-acetyltransferase [Candidatus Bathyarchaeia archaeon]